MTNARTARRTSWIKVRKSPVHGRGVFALRRIRKGTRIIEYLGERVSHREADRRYEDRDCADSHTFLFIVDSRTVIDGGTHGNDSRFINHCCDPNCESVIEGGRVFIEAIRTIQPGEELSYDYQLGRDADDPPNVDEIYACRCGAAQCRGTMLWPPKKSPQSQPGRTRPRRPTRADTGPRGSTKRRSAPAVKRAAATAGKRATRRARSGKQR